MVRVSEESTVFTYFTDEENDMIEAWLLNHNFGYDKNTICGDCCGMYEETYWVNGIGGEFPKEAQKEFVEFAVENGIGAKVHSYHIEAFDGKAHLDN